MSKLQALAERIASTHKKLNDDADKLMARLDKVDTTASVTIDQANAHLDRHEADVSGIENTLRQLSNEV